VQNFCAEGILIDAHQVIAHWTWSLYPQLTSHGQDVLMPKPKFIPTGVSLTWLL